MQEQTVLLTSRTNCSIIKKKFNFRRLIMRKILSVSLVLIFMLSLFSGCATQQVEITAENFENYFSIDVYTSNYKFTDGILPSGSLTVNVTITPKQHIKSGYVSVVLYDDFFSWSSDYRETGPLGGTRLSLEFSPTQTYTKSFNASSIVGLDNPTISFDVEQASGSISI